MTGRQSATDRLDPGDVAGVEATWRLFVDSHVGGRWPSRDALAAWLSSEGCGWVLRDGATVAAAAAAHRLSAAEAAGLVERWAPALGPLDWLVAGTGYMTAAATTLGWRRRGAHTALVAARVAHFAACGADDVVTVSWCRDDDASMPQLTAAGFAVLGEIDRYWPGYDDRAALLHLRLPRDPDRPHQS